MANNSIEIIFGLTHIVLTFVKEGKLEEAENQIRKRKNEIQKVELRSKRSKVEEIRKSIEQINFVISKLEHGLKLMEIQNFESFCVDNFFRDNLSILKKKKEELKIEKKSLARK